MYKDVWYTCTATVLFIKPFSHCCYCQGFLKLPSFINNCITTGVYLPKVYVEFFNRAPLKSRFCGPKALQKRTSNIFI